MVMIRYVYIFICLYLIIHIKCFAVNSQNKDGLYDNCSSLFCSNHRLSNIYENSKVILAELENLLYDLRDEKVSHQLENEFDKKLDIELKFPTSENYKDLAYLTTDEEFDKESEYSQPVPYITINRSEEDPEDFEKSILSSNINQMDYSADRDLRSDEEIDIALSRIHDLEERRKRFNDEKRRYNFKRYLR